MDTTGQLAPTSPGSGRKRNRPWLVVGGTTIAVLFVLITTALLQIRTPSARLSDGRLVRLKAITFGRDCTFPQTSIQRLIAPFLTTNLAARLGIRKLRLPQRLPLLVCWLSVDKTAGTPPTLMVAVADEEGHETTAQYPVLAGAPLAGNEYCLASGFSFFPRRSKMVRVRVYLLNKGRRERPADFIVKNPGWTRVTSWKPDALPITKRSRTREFSLTAFRTGLYATGWATNNAATWTLLHFNYEPPDVRWTPELVEVTDASGNVFQERRPNGRLVTVDALERDPSLGRPSIEELKRQDFISLPIMLWEEEPAYKVRVQFRGAGESHVVEFQAKPTLLHAEIANWRYE